MIRLHFRTAQVQRPMTPGQTRLIVQAVDEQDEPCAIFLCGIEPPNTLQRRMRESFHTVCSVEDMAEYPAGVACVQEVDPQTVDEGTFLYSVQENIVYERGTGSAGQPDWVPFRPRAENLNPRFHSHTLPFFRRSVIDIILPNREFVVQAVGWIEDAARQLEQDFIDLEKLKSYAQAGLDFP